MGVLAMNSKVPAERVLRRRRRTNLTSPEHQSTLGGTLSGFEISNACNIKATVIQTLSSAKNLPGQILGEPGGCVRKRMKVERGDIHMILKTRAPPTETKRDPCGIRLTVRRTGARLVSLWDEFCRTLVDAFVVKHSAVYQLGSERASA